METTEAKFAGSNRFAYFDASPPPRLAERALGLRTGNTTVTQDAALSYQLQSYLALNVPDSASAEQRQKNALAFVMDILHRSGYQLAMADSLGGNGISLTDPNLLGFVPSKLAARSVSRGSQAKMEKSPAAFPLASPLIFSGAAPESYTRT